MVEGATTSCLVSVYDRRAPPEIGTKEARLVELRPEFSLVYLLLLTTRLAAAPSAMLGKSPLSDPMFVQMPEKVPQLYRAERLLVSITDPNPRL